MLDGAGAGGIESAPMRAPRFVLIAVLAGCGGGGDDEAVDAGVVTLAFTAPGPRAALTRDVLEPTAGWVAAPVAIDVAITGDVWQVEITDGDRVVGVLDAAGHLDAHLTELGAATLTATGRDWDGNVLATTTVDVTVGDPELATCRDWLDHYGVTYVRRTGDPGVDDGVTVTTPINGMVYRYLGNTNPRATFFMDCSLARSLVRAAPHWRTRGIVEVQDIGVYNYRCIGSGTPPNCPNGFSQHAFAKAIDLARFVHADGTTYTVETDWVIDPTSGTTCTAATEGDKDSWLHQVICALKTDAVWNIVLTPNYNASHRDHFHVDLTEGSDFIRGRRPIDDGPDDY